MWRVFCTGSHDDLSSLCQTEDVGFHGSTPNVSKPSFLRAYLIYVFVYHYPGLHKLGDNNVDKPFYVSSASWKSIAFTLVQAQRHFKIFCNFVFFRNLTINAESVVLKKGMVLEEPNMDLFNPLDGLTIPMTRKEKE